MKVLHVDSSILGTQSVSRQLSAAIVARLKEQVPDLSLTYRDLAAHPLEHLSSAYLAAGQSLANAAEPALVHDLAESEAALCEFLDADIVVIGSPMYNFAIPSQLKSWIDRLAVAGRTFRYTESGPLGLAGGKRVIVALARGGFYGPGSAAEPIEHHESYLRAIFGMFGVVDFVLIAAEGVAVSPETREVAITDAIAKIAEADLVSSFE